MVTVDPWLSTLRSLAAEVVTLVLCQVLVGLPSWGCSASGFLGPAVFLVFMLGSPVSGRDCLLPQSAIVTFAFPPSGGFGYWPSCGVPCLRLMLCASACVGPGGCPFFSRVGPAPSHWVPLLWTWLVWEASTVFLLLCIPSGCGHPFGSLVPFLSLLIANEGFHWRWLLLRCSLPFRGSVVVFLRPL